MKKNNSSLTKLDNFLAKQVDKYAIFVQNREIKSFSYYFSNIVFVLISWFLAALTSIFIYKMLPEVIPEGIRKLIFGVSYFGSFGFLCISLFSNILKN